MRPEGAIDLAIAALAATQHGVVSRAQLLTLGLSDEAISRRLRSGRLHRIHRGVFAVGHPLLTVKGRWLAAVLAGGANAVLSHASAAAAWDLRPVGGGAIHVTIPGDAGRKRRAGIRVHRSGTLTPDQTTAHDGIPITTPIRTLVDLAATLRGRPLEQVLDRADFHRLVDFAELRRTLAAHPTRPGSPSLQAVLSNYTVGSTWTRSELEERLVRLCDDHGLPRPETNTRIEGVEVDAVWRHVRLTVEVDGYRYHRRPSVFETDRERDVMLTLAGWQVLRFTYAQVTHRRAWVAAAIGDRLASSGR